MNDKVIRGPPSCPVAVDNILGWILRDSTRSRKLKRQENVNFIPFVTMCIETKTVEQNLKEELNKFWETDNVIIG